jgi:hypothetical protein
LIFCGYINLLVKDLIMSFVGTARSRATKADADQKIAKAVLDDAFEDMNTQDVNLDTILAACREAEDEDEARWAISSSCAAQASKRVVYLNAATAAADAADKAVVAAAAAAAVDAALDVNHKLSYHLANIVGLYLEE